MTAFPCLRTSDPRIKRNLKETRAEPEGTCMRWVTTLWADERIWGVWGFLCTPLPGRCRETKLACRGRVPRERCQTPTAKRKELHSGCGVHFIKKSKQNRSTAQASSLTTAVPLMKQPGDGCLHPVIPTPPLAPLLAATQDSSRRNEYSGSLTADQG